MGYLCKIQRTFLMIQYFDILYSMVIILSWELVRKKNPERQKSGFSATRAGVGLLKCFYPNFINLSNWEAFLAIQTLAKLCELKYKK